MLISLPQGRGSSSPQTSLTIPAGKGKFACMLDRRCWEQSIWRGVQLDVKSEREEGVFV